MNAITNLSPILNTDSYKPSHYLQYLPGTEYVSSYIEARGGSLKLPKSVFFGLQMFIKTYLMKPITLADIEEAETFLPEHGEPFNKAGWLHILNEHGGYLPIEIQAVPEGTVMETQNVQVQVINTDPECEWLTSYVETALLRAVWYPSTVSTISWNIKNIIHRYLEETADSTEGLPFKLHDFGARGASSLESAAIGGCAHLVNFMGSDTMAGVIAAKRYYGEPMAGFSIPAAEHSTTTMAGPEAETETYRRIMNAFLGPEKMVAVVSDSYDIDHAVSQIWGETLKEEVMNSGGTVVIRPDSGDPVEVVTRILKTLMSKYGYRVNTKGYRVLPDCIRVLQGDGINAESIEAILASLKANQISAENIAFGMGGALLQAMTRDCLGYAMKASARKEAKGWHDKMLHTGSGEWKDVYKDPITDPGKRSKRGRLALIINTNGQYQTIRESELAGRRNELISVFRNGKLLVDQTFVDIRQRANTVELAKAA